MLKKLKLVTALASGVLLMISCGGSSEQSDSRGGWSAEGRGNFGGGPATSVEVIPVKTGTISDQVQSYGSVRARDVVSVTPQVSNRITEIFVDLGDNVSQGQVMAKIYDIPFRDAVEQAEAQLRQNRVNFERDSSQFKRQEELFNRDLISRSELDIARATYLNSRSQLESAKAALSQSQDDLDNTEIRSPVFGVVLNRYIAEGDVATTGQVAFDVANLTGFETRLFLPLQDWEVVEVGQEVSMNYSNRTSEVATGIVSRISPQLDPVTGLGEVVVTLTETTNRIYQGALVQARINLTTKEDVVIIPRSAMIERVDTYIEPETGTIELERTYSVFVAQGDSTAVRRELTLGIQQGDRIEVMDGLQANEGLIVTGNRGLEDGSRIQVSRTNYQSASADTSSPDSLQIDREKFQDMTPEERREMRSRMQERRNSGNN